MRLSLADKLRMLVNAEDAGALEPEERARLQKVIDDILLQNRIASQVLELNPTIKKIGT